MQNMHETNQFLKVRSANEHNLKNVNINIPKNKLIEMLEREKRFKIFEKCMTVVPTLVDMEISGFKTTIFEKLDNRIFSKANKREKVFKLNKKFNYIC